MRTKEREGDSGFVMELQMPLEYQAEKIRLEKTLVTLRRKMDRFCLGRMKMSGYG